MLIEALWGNISPSLNRGNFVEVVVVYKVVNAISSLLKINSKRIPILESDSIPV